MPMIFSCKRSSEIPVCPSSQASVRFVFAPLECKLLNNLPG
nr:MAG TPA: hypothetical protein [Bacteriophage sp.]